MHGPCRHGVLNQGRAVESVGRFAAGAMEGRSGRIKSLPTIEGRRWTVLMQWNGPGPGRIDLQRIVRSVCIQGPARRGSMEEAAGNK